MKAITTKAGEIVVVEIPNNINKFWIHFESNSGETRVSEDTNGMTRWDECLEKGLHVEDYAILGKLSDLSEAECSMLLGTPLFKYETRGDIKVSWIPTPELDGEFTAKQSLISLLQSNGIDTNKNQLIIQKL